MPRAGLDTAAVVDAAATIADAEGLEALTLAGLAAALGVRAPSLYAHVDGLEDLRRRLGARGARGLADALGRAAAGRSGTEALEAVADAYRAYARAHPGSYAAAQRARELSGSDEAIAAATAAVDVVLAVLRGYGLEGDDAVHATREIRAALHGFVLLEAVDGFAIDLSIDESFRRLVATLDAGLRASR
ncbi:MAG TPA: TetR-like C-terminal domain-containing protein [Solirubrobacteraceae bacterium]|nr:TetR-like C-terminal domain-containing protein [Solirubrobacteraceae bacterium]